ncbi:hypothetical protein VTK56DRAFT_8617 [Thermocarpiscus australiensis]
MASPSSQLPEVIMADDSLLNFIFKGDEMMVQCTASPNDVPNLRKLLQTGLRNYQQFNDGKHAAVVRCHKSRQYWITSVQYAQTLDENDYTVVATTKAPVAIAPAGKPVTHHKITKVHIPRPRNQFILYRQWMSGKIHAENPGMTAAYISRIVANMWRSEKPEVKAHFKALADEEDRRHKLAYPGYRYEAGRNPQPALRNRHLSHDPMTIAERLIEAGY